MARWFRILPNDVSPLLLTAAAAAMAAGFAGGRAIMSARARRQRVDLFEIGEDRIELVTQIGDAVISILALSMLGV